MGCRVGLVLLASGCGRLAFEGVDAEVVAPTFGPPAIVSELHDAAAFGEEDPSLTGDMLEVVFERGAKLWRAQRATIGEPFGAPALIEELNVADEFTPELSSDGLTLTFASDRTGLGDIYVTTRSDRSLPWSPPQLIEALSSPASDEGAVATADLRVVVLASARLGGDGNFDLFVATGSGNAYTWDAPTNLAVLNSPEDDLAPFVHEPTHTLYFASTRDPARSKDLYAARYDGLVFYDPVRIDELDSDERESDPWVSPDGTTIYFARDVSGFSQIFRATR